jgi:hypothetical protein
MLSERAILIGACGWQHPQWNDSYYPEGLPEEWQLAFYGNEYPVVLVPAAYWLQGRRAIDAWLQETDTRPNFICEWSFDYDRHAQDEMYELITALGERVEGILLSLHGMPDDKQLATMNKLAESYAICLDWPHADRGQLQTLLAQPQIAQRVSVCWHGEVEHKSDLEHGRLVLARVDCEGQTPRSLRAILEAMLACTDDRQGVLLFDGQPPDLEIMDQAEVLLNLL